MSADGDYATLCNPTGVPLESFHQAFTAVPSVVPIISMNAIVNKGGVPDDDPLSFLMQVPAEGIALSHAVLKSSSGAVFHLAPSVRGTPLERSLQGGAGFGRMWIGLGRCVTGTLAGHATSGTIAYDGVEVICCVDSNGYRQAKRDFPDAKFCAGFLASGCAPVPSHTLTEISHALHTNAGRISIVVWSNDAKAFMVTLYTVTQEGVDSGPTLHVDSRIVDIDAGWCAKVERLSEASQARN